MDTEMTEIGVLAKWFFRNGILLSVLSIYFLQICDAEPYEITIGQQLKVSDTLQSKSGFYELGFFSPAPNSTNLYLGIWFTKAKTKAIVWVSNRDQPFTSDSPVLSLEDDGNLAVLDGETSYKVTNATAEGKNPTAVLLDSGNLVIQDETNSEILWESFDYPSDTILPGMKIGYDKTKGKLWAARSWKSPIDPSSGSIRWYLHPNGTTWAVIERHVHNIDFAYSTFWYGDKLNTNWSMEVENSTVVFNYSMPSKDYATLTFEVNTMTDFFMRYVVGSTGQLKVLIWSEGYLDWRQLFSLPNRECDFYGFCGKYSICDQSSSRNPCSCLPGYDQLVPDNWENENYADGCKRIADLQCGNSSLKSESENHFKELTGVTLPILSHVVFGLKSDQECRSLCTKNCSCNGYSFKNSRCSIFDTEVTNVQRLPNADQPNGESIFIRVPVSELNNPQDAKQYVLTGWKLWLTVIATLSAAVISTSLSAYHLYKDKISRVEAKDLLSYDFHEPIGQESGSGEEHGIGLTKYQIPLFKFSSVCAATDDFSATNKLGKGGFGAVYKGRLQSGEEIAVKRLSKLIPGKGSKEIRNEALLIAEIQHVNLVRLLGCCIEGNENIIIYEYFPLRSLDNFLFDPAEAMKLDWKTRACIIDGIAAGLNYLHEYSRMQIIHGDIKASNIMLDQNMNPKLSDFAMTRIFGAQETLATNRMFGTFGYMSPEHTSRGIVSNKSDVFSFGVLMLEILTGKKNNYRSASSLNLMGFAWDLWKSGRPLDLVDSNIRGTSSGWNVERYIEIALVCVQESDNDRPTMSDVVLYLGNQGMPIPAPKEPAFSKAKAAA